MIKISASLISDYLVCPHRAYYRVNNPEESIVSNEALAGRIVHDAISKFNSNIDKAIEYVGLKLAKYTLEDVLVNRVYECVDNYFSMYNFSSSAEYEKAFNYTSNKNNCIITGKFDCIFIDDIYEWKTGFYIGNIERNPQVILYYLAYQQIYKRPPDGIHVVSLFSTSKVRFHPNQKIIEYFDNILIPKIVEDIENNRLIKTGLYSYDLCNKCFFKDFCWKEAY